MQVTALWAACRKFRRSVTLYFYAVGVTRSIAYTCNDIATLLCDDIVLSHIGVADSPISPYSIDQDESGPFVAKKGKRKEETATISAPKSNDTISLYSTFRAHAESTRLDFIAITRIRTHTPTYSEKLFSFTSTKRPVDLPHRIAS